MYTRLLTARCAAVTASVALSLATFADAHATLPPASSIALTLTADIALAADYCSIPVSDPDADCINVPTGNPSLTYEPGADSLIVITYRLTNDSGTPLTKVVITDADRGTIVPVSTVQIAPGATFTVTRVFAAETAPRTVTPTVSAAAEDDLGASGTAVATYTLDVVAPQLGVVEWGVGRSRDGDCTAGKVIPNCFGLAGQDTARLGGRDSVSFYVRWINDGQSTIDVVSFTDSAPGPENAEQNDRTIDLSPGSNTIGAAYFLAPDAPGTYARTLTLTATDRAGNTATVDLDYVLVVEAPELGIVEWGIGRSRAGDCTAGKVIPNCFGLAGEDTVTVGGRDSVSMYVRWMNSGVDVIDIVSFSDTNPGPENAEQSSRSLDLSPGSNTIGAAYFLAPDAPGTYAYTLTLTATDRAGNTGTVALDYVIVVDCAIVDYAPPTASCGTATVLVTEGMSTALSPTAIDLGSSDNCTSLASTNLSIDRPTFTCADLGVEQVTLTVTDDAGNVATCVADVTVSPAVQPAIANDATCMTIETAVSQKAEWTDIYDRRGRIVASFRVNGNPDVAQVRVGLVGGTKILTVDGNNTYLTRRLTVDALDASGSVIPNLSKPVDLRIYLPEAALDALASAAGTAPDDLIVYRDDSACGSSATPAADAVALVTAFDRGGCGGSLAYLETTTESFSTFYVAAELQPLPVTLVDVAAGALPDGSVAVTWTTAEEVNHSHFLLEGRNEGSGFRSVARVDEPAAAADVATERHYRVVDTGAKPGWNYYRLRQVDLDGASEVSSVVSAFIDAAVPTLRVFPNPAEATITVTGSGEGRFTVYDARGAQCTTVTAMGNDQFDVSALAPGVYTVHDGTRTARFVKL